MRDNSSGMIEIIEALRKDESFFVIIAVPKNSERQQFCFGVTPAAYKAVRRVLQARPLDTLPSLKYRYFWNGSTMKLAKHEALLRIRCEVQQNGKSIDFAVPHNLAANLKWFSEIKTFSEAESFRVKS